MKTENFLIAEHKDNTIYFARCNAIFGITGVEVLLEIVSKYYLCSFSVNLVTTYVSVPSPSGRKCSLMFS